jgi:hypothetical protein
MAKTEASLYSGWNLPTDGDFMAFFRKGRAHFPKTLRTQNDDRRGSTFRATENRGPEEVD